ncbi:MAG TPA: 2Fe-2S iron-sulfur cluster-binding protein [Thermomicrobiaceae bacterium]|nr:2Fe-2S iron-sulfur cluster-binding protein [Thermomicrobiaceae bacterium]
MASPTPATLRIALNGNPPQQVTVPDGSVPLLYVLRDQFGLKGPKFGCGFGQCGACSVVINGEVARSCQATFDAIIALITTVYHAPADTPVSVTTLEGIGTPEQPHPLQQAFIDQQAGQCAYCANAMIMGAYAWLNGRIKVGNTAVPSVGEVEDFLSNSYYADPLNNYAKTPTPYLCRCGAHVRFVSAIQEAAKEMA